MARFLKLTHNVMGKLAINCDHMICLSPNEDGGTDIDLRDNKNLTVVEDIEVIWKKMGGKSWSQLNQSSSAKQ